MASIVNLPMPLIKSNVLRSVACTARYEYTGQEWQNMYLYMCCRMVAACEAYTEECGRMGLIAKAKFLNLMGNELSWALTVQAIAESRYPTLWEQPVLKAVLKALLSADPADPDNFRLDPIFSGLRFLYAANSQVWWIGDYCAGFAKFDQVVRAFHDDSTVNIDWESNKYWKNQGHSGARLTRHERIEQAKTAIALAIGQIDHRMATVKQELVRLGKKLDKYGEAVVYKPVEDAVTQGMELGS